MAFPHEVRGVATNTTGTAFRINLDTDTSFAVGGAIGAELEDWLRAELEVSFAQADVDNFSGNNATTAFAYGARGDLNAIYILANLWVDVPLETAGIKPYVGGGIGVGIVDADVRVGPGGLFGPNDTDAGFAFQVGGGIRYDWNQTISFDLGYRFKGITGLDFNDRAGGLANNRDFDLITHVVQAGLTFHLGGM